MILIKGNENYFIEKEVKNIIQQIKSKNNNEIEIINFFEVMQLEELSDAVYNTDIFAIPKLVIITNPIYFNSKSKFKKEEAEKFVELLLEGSQYNEIVLIQEIQKYDKNFTPSSYFKKIEKASEIIEVAKINDKDLYKFTNSLIQGKGGTIDDFALIQFVSNLPNDLTLIENEVNKLLLQDNHITLKMIDDNNFSMSNNIEYAFNDALLKLNSPKTIIAKMNEQLSFGQSPQQIIVQVASVISLAKEIQVLLEAKMTPENISSAINMHIYRVKLFTDFIRKIGLDKLNFLIEKMALIDKEIKSGSLDEHTALKLAVLEIIK
ncbi:DNA polymerase III subunit delta [Metamycoplasma neophronis]|uniref:DNA polymerase III subunit delta n=1 Tax=Metamycoplasma neophronis TaxID=872983 RepID=A0ABY2Z003_9BACT|nr:DNA polymerase III subunit delta [Metamycoplasma neophronis]TPR54069.1 DNA polymerase III subunit delta [Metamycoplasma neophronis]